MSEEEFSADCAAKLEELILLEGPDTVAAFIGEPVLGTGGILPPPAGYWPAIQAVLKKYDILLIADEVVTGFGRLGSMFGSTHYEIEADIITIAKGLTSAYAPLSGSIISEKMWSVLEQGTDEHEPIGHGWTYSAHPIGAAAGVANLKLIDEMGLVENSGKTGAYLLEQLKIAFADHPNVAEVRGEGLMCAVEFAKTKSPLTFFDPAQKIGYAISAAMASRDVIARALPQGDIIGFAPPLCITPDEVDQVVSAAKEAVSEVLG
jgi:L-2,4-diaminobutyrate transaminase